MVVCVPKYRIHMQLNTNITWEEPGAFAFRAPDLVRRISVSHSLQGSRVGSRQTCSAHLSTNSRGMTLLLGFDCSPHSLHHECVEVVLSGHGQTSTVQGPRGHREASARLLQVCGPAEGWPTWVRIILGCRIGNLEPPLRPTRMSSCVRASAFSVP